MEGFGAGEPCNHVQMGQRRETGGQKKVEVILQGEKMGAELGLEGLEEGG